ncbi:MAG: hypothetical protein ACQETE_12500 [Bacteroidota bacterium]
MSTAAYTLLLVESPTVAQIVTGFNLPYLEVIATHGYCWQPVWDSDSRSLIPRAHPDHVERRKRIAKQAQWASRVIIATDSDPSGVFIAHALHRFLNKDRTDLQRTFLSGLNPTSVVHAIEQATDYSATSYQQLVHRSRIQRRMAAQLSALFPDLPSRLYWTALALLSVPDPTEPIYQPAPQHGWSTVDLLLQASTVFQGRSYDELQQELQALFTRTNPETETGGLISYPRTSARGYYPDSWAYWERQWIKQRNIESFRPTALRPTIPSSSAHQSLHPLDLSLTPEIVRPQLTRTQFMLYKMIYDHHRHLLSCPLPDQQIVSGSALDPIHQALHFSALRPSHVGTALDQFIKQGWLRRSTEPENPSLLFLDHEAKHQMIRIAEPLSTVVQQLHQLVVSEHCSTDEIDQVLEPLTGRS